MAHLRVRSLERLGVDRDGTPGVAGPRHGDAADVRPVDQAPLRLELRAKQGSHGQHGSRADGSDRERPPNHVSATGRTHDSIIRVDRRSIGTYIEEPERPSM